MPRSASAACAVSRPCKIENNVALDAHHFRTWVERYVYLEGADHALVDSQDDPVNIAASGSEKTYRFANRYKDAKVEEISRRQAVQPVHASGLRAGVPHRRDVQDR